MANYKKKQKQIEEIEVNPEAVPEALPLEQAKPVEQSINFYHAARANQVVQGSFLGFHFTPYEMAGGVWMGILATNNEQEIQELDQLSTTGRVTKIDEKEYILCLKKNQRASKELGSSLINYQIGSQTIQPGGNPLVQAVNTEPESAAPQFEAAESVSDALAIGKV